MEPTLQSAMEEQLKILREISDRLAAQEARWRSRESTVTQHSRSIHDLEVAMASAPSATLRAELDAPVAVTYERLDATEAASAARVSALESTTATFDMLFDNSDIVEKFNAEVVADDWGGLFGQHAHPLDSGGARLLLPSAALPFASATDTAFSSIYGVECGTIHTYTAALTRPAALHKPLVVAHAKCSTPGHNRVCAETQRQGPRQARRQCRLRVHVRRLHFTGLQLHVRQHGRRRQHVVHVQRVLPGAELDGRGLRLPWPRVAHGDRPFRAHLQLHHIDPDGGGGGGHGITPPERWLSRAGAYNAAAPNEVDVLRWTLKGVLWPRVTYCIAGWIDLGDGVAEGADHAVRVRFRVDDGCVVEGGTVCAESGSWTEIKGVFRLKRNARVMEVYVQGAVAGIDVKVTDPQVFATNVIQNLAYVDFFTKHFDWAVFEKEFRWYHVEDAAKVFDKMLTKGEEAPSVQRGVVMTAVAHNLLVQALFMDGRASDAYVVLEEMQNNGPFPDVFTYTLKVLKNGQWAEEESTILVPGDIIGVKLGDIISADTRLLEGDPLKIDQSALTGNFCICSIVAGMLVEFIVMYPIQDMVYRPRIDKLLVLLIGGIPIAMPTVLSVTMSIGAYRLAQQGAITKRMTTIEEMAGMDVPCSDKTGTLPWTKLTVIKSLVDVFQRGADQDAVILMDARASCTKNQDAIEATIVSMLAAPKEACAGVQEIQFLPFNPNDKRTAVTYMSLIYALSPGKA
uniref:Putative Pol polyprotein from transposon element Bs1 n=1 Tax=Zea mays TaxID=4577 RepID=POLB_MAIZE|nr:RecName: Full=Putative Pol polyprotein from transposon element Bs1; Short=ORF 1 [Zea mays]AAA66269.1 unknown protein [Zea mays]CAA34210.1 unnamed protein product [Zea mays]